MKIENKISCSLKKRILESNIQSREDRKERAFVICLEKDGKWTPAKEESIGGGQKVVPTGSCTFSIQGTYHNHPIVKKTVEHSRNVIPEEMITEEEVIKILSKTKRKDVLDAIKPTQTDVVSNIIDKFEGNSNGTMCTGSDAKPNIVECWTINKSIDPITYRRALKDHLYFKTDPSEEWTKKLSDIDIIDLRRIKC